jgi:hypothetical protein
MIEALDILVQYEIEVTNIDVDVQWPRHLTRWLWLHESEIGVRIFDVGETIPRQD